MRLGRPLAVHPVLLAAYFVLFLWAGNLGEVSFDDVAPALVVAVAAALATTALTMIGMAIARRGDLRRAALVATAAVVVFFGYGHVEALVRPWEVPGWLLQAGALTVVVGALAIAVRARDRLGPITRNLNILAAILLATALVPIVPHELARAAPDPLPPPPVPVAGEGVAGPKRDVWYLVFDRYASSSALRESYGFDNPLDAWLTERGFYVAPEAHANYVKTQLSLASSLNLTYLDELAGRMGPESDDEQPVYDSMQAHVVARFLKSQGYEFVQVGSRYQPTNRNAYADRNPTLNTQNDFVTGLLDTTVLPALARRLGLDGANGDQPSMSPRERYWTHARFQWAELHELVGDPGPKFVFTHFLVPHPPYVFAADGSFIAQEQPRHEQVGPYLDQVRYVNGELQRLVERLLALPEDRRPIIVLQADEGPYPARYDADSALFDWSIATGEELRLKFGILAAFHLPGIDDDAGLYPTVTPVNCFRLILSRYFGADLPRLPDRIYTSRNRYRPYDLTDVTERLLAP